MPLKSAVAPILVCVILSALSAGRPVLAGPPPAPAKSAAPRSTVSPSAPRVIPDYGGRNSDIGSTLDGSGAAAPLNPLAQAGRAFEALVIVLVVVVGGLYLLKRSGIVKSSGAEMTAAGGGPPWSFLLPQNRPAVTGGGDDAATIELLTVLGSQVLPQSGGARLHLVSVAGRLLLLGATAQSVTLLTEVGPVADLSDEAVGPQAETPEEALAFADYLAKVGMEPPPAMAGKAVEAKLAAATGRLKSLVRPPHRS